MEAAVRFMTPDGPKLRRDAAAHQNVIEARPSVTVEPVVAAVVWIEGAIFQLLRVGKSA